MSAPKIRKVWVDEDICLAHFLCIGEAPLIFEENEQGYAVRAKTGLNESLLLAESENILWATAICPVAAIKIELVNGKVIDSESSECRKFLASKKQSKL